APATPKNPPPASRPYPPAHPEHTPTPSTTRTPPLLRTKLSSCHLGEVPALYLLSSPYPTSYSQRELTWVFSYRSPTSDKYRSSDDMLYAGACSNAGFRTSPCNASIMRSNSAS